MGLATGAAASAFTVTDDAFAPGDVVALLVGWSFLASGWVARARRPENGIGDVMVLIGFAWFLGRVLRESHSPVLFTAGVWLSDLWYIPFTWLLAAFPAGRILTRLERWLFGVIVFVAAPLEALWLTFLEFPPGVPHNALLISPDPGLASKIDTVQRILAIAALSALAVVLVRRWLRASRLMRRVLTPILAAAVALGLMSLYLFLDKVGAGHEWMLYVQFAVLACVPLAFLIGLLRARLARSALGDLLVDLREPAAPGRLREALARALRDPSLELAYWVPEYAAYAGVDGRPMELPPEGGDRVATLVERGGTHVAALIHDASLRDEPELVGAVTSAAGIALENERLQAELRARLGELKASRARIVEAGDAERRRLERDLHDGAQQRLVSLSLLLRLLAGRLPEGAEAELLAGARDELATSIEELRRLAQGIHPAVLSDHGLPVALESLAALAPVPVALHVDLAERLPEPVEVAAYYLVAEGLTNVAKYAQARRASVDVARRNGTLVVEVADDGKGGADPGHGSGLRGLADRLEAVDGRLRVWSPAAGGTRLRGEIPCA